MSLASSGSIGSDDLVNFVDCSNLPYDSTDLERSKPETDSHFSREKKIDIMTAPISELVEVRGVGLAKAKDIEALRERDGGLSRSLLEGLSTFQGADLSAFNFPTTHDQMNLVESHMIKEEWEPHSLSNIKQDPEHISSSHGTRPKLSGTQDVRFERTSRSRHRDGSRDNSGRYCSSSRDSKPTQKGYKSPKRYHNSNERSCRSPKREYQSPQRDYSRHRGDFNSHGRGYDSSYRDSGHPRLYGEDRAYPTSYPPIHGFGRVPDWDYYQNFGVGYGWYPPPPIPRDSRHESSRTCKAVLPKNLSFTGTGN